MPLAALLGVALGLAHPPLAGGATQALRKGVKEVAVKASGEAEHGECGRRSRSAGTTRQHIASVADIFAL